MVSENIQFSIAIYKKEIRLVMLNLRLLITYVEYYISMGYYWGVSLINGEW